MMGISGPPPNQFYNEESSRRHEQMLERMAAEDTIQRFINLLIHAFGELCQSEKSKNRNHFPTMLEG